MQDTYTFSRALHMMRYGGKKMRSVNEDLLEYFLMVEDNVIFGCEFVKSSSFIKNKLSAENFGSWISPSDLMGSWVEVHGGE